MKQYIIFFLIQVFLQLKAKQVTDGTQIIVDEDLPFKDFHKSICEDNCVYGQKFEADFPGDAHRRDNEDDLPVVSWKYIFLYKDKISVFKSKLQEAPSESGIPISDMPTQMDFENSYPLSTFALPCHQSVCTVFELKNLELELQGEAFQVDHQIAGDMGADIDNCVVLMQDLAKTESYFTICSKQKIVMDDFKSALTRLIREADPTYIIGKIDMMTEDGKNEIPVYLHLNRQYLMANNDKDVKMKYSEKGDYEELPPEPKQDYQEYFRIDLIHDFVSPLAEHKGINNITFVWKGAAGGPEDLDRCFQIFFVIRDGPKCERHKLTLCVAEDAKDAENYDEAETSLKAGEWADKIKKYINLGLLKISQTILKDEKADITSVSPALVPIRQVINQYGVTLDQICQLQVKNDVTTMEKCQMKNKISLSEHILETCMENQKCITIISNDIASGSLPIKSTIDYANDPNNGYVDLQTVAHQCVRAFDSKEGLEKYFEGKVKRINIVDKPTEDMPKHPGVLVHPLIPNKKKIMDAYRRIQFGCKHMNHLIRQLSFQPQVGRFDPWLEYLGYIHDGAGVWKID